MDAYLLSATVGSHEHMAQIAAHKAKFAHIHQGMKQAKVALAKPAGAQKGFFLDMGNGGRDTEDNEFEKF